MKNTSFRYQDLIDDHANLEHVTVLKILENPMPVIVYHRFKREVSRFNSFNKTSCGNTEQIFRLQFISQIYLYHF